MVHFQVVDVDVERVRSQLADELSRPVSDLEVSVWLRRCGFIKFNNLWIADTPSMRKSHPILREIPIPYPNHFDATKSDESSFPRVARHR